MSADDGRAAQRGDRTVEERAFADELERRLEVIESPDYEDAARRDLPALEIAIVLLVSVVVIVLIHVWGY